MAQDWVTLTRWIRVAKPYPNFATRLFLTNPDYSPIPKVTLRNMDATVTAAPLRALYSGAVSQNGSFTFNESSIEPPQIFITQPITEQLLLSQISDPSILIADKNSVIQNKDFVYAKAVEDLKRKVLNRLELMAGQILGTGGISYDDGNYQYTLSFATPENLTITQDTDDVVRVLQDLVSTQKSQGFAPKYIIVSPDVAKGILDNPYFDKYVTKSNYDIGNINVTSEPYVNLIASIPGLPPILSYAATIGSETTFPSTGKLVLVDTEGLGIAYGAVANKNIDPNMNPKMGDIFAFEINSADGSSIDVAAISRPLPFVLNAKALKIFNVTIQETAA